ncbi:aldo/keto reductase family protein [Nitzschia inconspicua]|uniref:Aldo/keto reductase family protein n=1 Tax=Nitzschia inconspicua TaxID=303405 RepID=A0A9K3PEH0_9STRA|nr:aldo/keto reductase family protein [Nitzschia inconspicua]
MAVTICGKAFGLCHYKEKTEEQHSRNLTVTSLSPFSNNTMRCITSKSTTTDSESKNSRTINIDQRRTHIRKRPRTEEDNMQQSVRNSTQHHPSVQIHFLVLLVIHLYSVSNSVNCLSLSPSSSFHSPRPSSISHPLPSRLTSQSSSRKKRQTNENPSSSTRPSPPSPPHDVPPKIEFVNFWGTKVSSEDGDGKSDGPKVDPRMIPCDETLDLYDGPLPPGAYLVDGKSTFDPKRTCRVSLSLNLFNNKERTDPIELIKRLQSCVDAGFQTFELQQQTRQGLEWIGAMRQQTPSYVETHWSLRYQVPTNLVSSTNKQQREIRQSVLSLLQQSKMGDTIDSLQLVYNPQSPYTLDTLDCLVELQREGLVRSIGLQGNQQHQMPLPRFLLQQIQAADMIRSIDFIKQAGNLLLPPPSSTVSVFDSMVDDTRYDCFPHLWMEDALAGTLLTALDDPQKLYPLDEKLLREWANRHDRFDNPNVVSSPAAFRDLWGRYQGQVVEKLRWIALKYRVKPTAVALRWILEEGASTIDDTSKHVGRCSPIVSSAMMNCDLTSYAFNENGRVPVEWRKVFRFQLDEEDRTMLENIPAPSMKAIEKREGSRSSSGPPNSRSIDGNPEDALNDWDRELLEYEREMKESAETPFNDDDYPEIDFNNKALWL